MVFLFGLIHGMGLSTRLQSFDIGEADFLGRILSFNLGVELGQSAVLIPVIFINQQWQKRESYEAIYKAVNLYLVIAGVALTAYQIWQYAHGGH